MFSDSLHHSLPFPIAFIFRLGHFGTCPPSSRPTSYPIVSGCYCLPSSDISGFFPSSSRFASCSTSSGYFAFTFGSFRMFLSSQIASFSIIAGCFRLSDIVGCSRLLHDSFRVPSFPNAPAFHVRLSCITSSSSRFASYSITSEFVSLLPVLAGHKEFDPGPLSLETEPSSMWCWELLDPLLAAIPCYLHKKNSQAPLHT